MNRTACWLLALGALAGASGVAVGAFATHGLRARLDPQALEWIDTGVRYHLVHAVALVVLAVLALWLPSRLVAWAGWIWTAGIILFSGSLYLLALTAWRPIVYVTPFGGMAFIGGWLLLIVLAWRRRSDISR